MVMGIFYFLFGFLYTLIGVAMIFLGGGKFRVIGTIYLFMPVICGILGSIFFAIFAAVYNGVAKFLGGIEVEVRDIEEPAEDRPKPSD